MSSRQRPMGETLARLKDWEPRGGVQEPIQSKSVAIMSMTLT
jgi:hypothetical protein